MSTCPTCYGLVVEPNQGISYSGKLCLCNRMNIPNPRTFETQLDLANEMIADKEADCVRLHSEKMGYYMKSIEQEARIKQLEDAIDRAMDCLDCGPNCSKFLDSILINREALANKEPKNEQ